MNKKISAAIEGKVCAHIACGCPVGDGEDYCSPACEKAFGETDCNCGHADCQARA
jgi:hypothetical protein